MAKRKIFNINGNEMYATARRGAGTVTKYAFVDPSKKNAILIQGRGRADNKKWFIKNGEEGKWKPFDKSNMKDTGKTIEKKTTGNRRRGITGTMEKLKWWNHAAEPKSITLQGGIPSPSDFNPTQWQGIEPLDTKGNLVATRQEWQNAVKNNDQKWLIDKTKSIRWEHVGSFYEGNAESKAYIKYMKNKQGNK